MDTHHEEIGTKRLTIKVLSSTVETIEKYVKQNVWINELQSITEIIRHEIMKVDKALDLYVDAIQAASNHRMAYGVLSFKAATEALNKIKSMAKYRQLTNKSINWRPHSSPQKMVSLFSYTFL